jgi:hemolysin activation/secretion protein
MKACILKGVVPLGKRGPGFERTPMLKYKWSPCWALLLAHGAWAQTLPSAGGQMQQLPIVPMAPGALAPNELRSAPAPSNPVASTAMFKVHRLQVSGASVYPEADLLKLAGFEPGHDLSLQALQAMADRITQHYRKNGYLLARAYVPAQEIQEGVVTLSVLEGQYGQIKLNNTSSLNNEVPQEVLTGLNYGDVIASRPLEERLLLLSDIPGVRIQSTLIPGATLGLSDLVVSVSSGARFSGSIDADNAGNLYTGKNRVGATVQLNNPNHRGDLASLRVLTSGSGLGYARMAYQAPVGRGRLGVAYSDLSYQLGLDFASLGANGHAKTATLFGTYPLLRSRQSNMNVGMTLETKTFEDRLDVEPSIAKKSAQVAVATVYGDHRDGLGGGGLNTYSLAWSVGTIDIRTPAAQIRDANTARSEGHYNKLSLALARVQRIHPSVNLTASLRGQVASKNLDISEKMELGGMNGVRAYPEGEAYADEGYLLTLEARKQLDLLDATWGQMHVAAFADVGEVRLQHTPWSAGTQRRRLGGAGLGLYWTYSRDFAIKAFYARKLGHEDAISAPDKSGRLWVQAVKYF